MVLPLTTLLPASLLLIAWLLFALLLMALLLMALLLIALLRLLILRARIMNVSRCCAAVAMVRSNSLIRLATIRAMGSLARFNRSLIRIVRICVPTSLRSSHTGSRLL